MVFLGLERGNNCVVFRLPYELTRIARKDSHYLLRFGIGGLASRRMGMPQIWHHVLARDRRFESHPRKLAAIIKVAFLAIIQIQGLMIVLLVPELSSSDRSLSEDRRNTDDYSLDDSLSDQLHRVLGKLVSCSGFYLAIAIAIGLPLVAPLGLSGFLDVRIVACAYAILITMTISISSLSMMVAVLVNRPRWAISAAYLLDRAWLLIPVWLSPFLRNGSTTIPWLVTGVLQSQVSPNWATT